MKPRFAAVFFVITISSGMSLSLPQRLETAHLLGPGLNSGIPPVALQDELYALGWSRENLFVALERRTEVPALSTCRLRVYDLVQDVIVYEEQGPSWSNENDRESWWAEKKLQWGPLFERLKIVATDRQLGLFPLIVDNEYYQPALRLGHSSQDPQWIDRIQYVIRSTGRGLKSFLDLRGYWKWATILGFIPSPFENRVAVISLVQPSGWKGESQPLRFWVTGLSLKAGFPKP